MSDPIKFQHPVHGECEVIDQRLSEHSKSMLVNRVRDGAKLYLSTTYLENAKFADQPEQPAPNDA